jgi:hypothetical protein
MKTKRLFFLTAVYLILAFSIYPAILSYNNASDWDIPCKRQKFEKTDFDMFVAENYSSTLESSLGAHTSFLDPGLLAFFEKNSLDVSTPLTSLIILRC